MIPFLGHWGEPLSHDDPMVQEIARDKRWLCEFCEFTASPTRDTPMAHMEVCRKHPADTRHIESGNTHLLCAICAPLTSTNKTLGERGSVIEAGYISQGQLNNMLRLSYAATHFGTSDLQLAQTCARFLNSIDTIPIEWKDQFAWEGEFESLREYIEQFDPRRTQSSGSYARLLRFRSNIEPLKPAIEFWSKTMLQEHCL